MKEYTKDIDDKINGHHKFSNEEIEYFLFKMIL